ncbi:MAG: glutathione S-transferase [Saccharospirillaceae bacterium]|jgi:glutathione S-transferase|nr:glutathione S-transferase [Thalassolituus sp. HI0120]MCH2040270.1 glutathione S-transferase [Saccharospirillaceae bacterium]
MITLHHLNNSRSQRIIWLLEELGVDYQIKHYQRDEKTSLAPKALEAVHPLGKSPVITDGEQTIAESGLIIDYLMQTYGATELPQSTESDTKWQSQYWLHYAEGSLMPLLLIALMFEKVRTAPMPFFIKPIARTIADKAMAAYAGPNMQKHLGYINNHLADKQWLCGEHKTAADYQMIFPLEAALTRGATREAFPHVARYVDQIHALPSYKTALEKGGPYDYA